MADSAPLRWRALRRLMRWVVWRTARRHLIHREIRLTSGDRVRWLDAESDEFRTALTDEIASLHRAGFPAAELSGGSPLIAELAVVTVAADRALRRKGVAASCSRALVADMGWDLYRRMLLSTSLPFRLITRDPARRLRWTLNTLLVFPFRPVGAPGYEAEIVRDAAQVRTHFTHCPPQSLARAVSERNRDPEVLEAFRQSWCLYDWPGADLIAGDGRRGHYGRERTLSAGDPVCDMCWAARATGEPQHSRAGACETERAE
ncbi:hypothetical protein RDV64_08560 [Acuticoccus sp. MNP-M23]|uniref:hypothetical protein n=1 Tax=Acuticoccus sp. MNP-M23 TaxID=3072793 RepID=UPI002814F63A|nr:hypothetical protein [Acuticoccus sp. MNP-M23]WMS44425.1 hypothetical protein RDV64_08560 [Acuticoccus sp. MNP-M23]